MDEMQFMGYLVSAIITLGGFIAIIMKFVQPINDLRVVIQKLNDNIDAIKNQNETHEMRITQHGKEIDELDTRVGTLETKMDMYHK
jgi:chromosome segregation ATPase